MTAEKINFLDDLLEDIEAFLNQRQDRIYEAECLSKEYAREEILTNNILCGLRNNMASYEFKKVNQLNSAKNHMEVISNSVLYKNGFRDGVKTLALILVK
jgi:hypothetical protein